MYEECGRLFLGLCRLLQDSAYNLDPETPDLIDDFTAAMLMKEGKELSDLGTEIVEAPFVQVQAGTRIPVVCDPPGLTSVFRHGDQVSYVFTRVGTLES